jgi:thioredoxin reductase (NADPH)
MENVVIIGTGCAGLTAAIYTARADLGPLVIEGDLAGGQLGTTTLVENFPGFPAGVDGPVLMQRMREQAVKFGSRVQRGLVTDVDVKSSPFRLIVDEEITIEAKTIVMAAGASPKLLGLESEKKLWARGVSSCATCDGAFFKSRAVAVIGGGDTAMEDGIFLTRFANSVTVIHRRDVLRASKIMQDRAFANPKIKFLWDSIVTEVLDVAKNEVTGVRIQNVNTTGQQILPVQGLFIAIGHEPNTKIFRNKLELDEQGYIRVQYPSTRTNVPGIFACGDCVDHVYRQAVTAAGTGCAAAIDAERYLSHQNV